MKGNIIYFLCGAFLLLNISAFGQKDSHEDRREKYRLEKVAFLTTNLNLTPAEAEKFWPVYNQMEKERWEAQKARRDLEMKVSDAEESLSEKEVVKLTKDFAGSMQKEAALLTKYNDKFLEILPPKKVLKLYKTENEFRMHMIKMYRDRNRND